MDHHTALETNAAERYHLGELSDAERDAFEEHYFECPACADDVATAAQFVDGLRKVTADEKDEKKVIPFPRRKFTLPLSAAAAALLAFVGYQNAIVIPRMGAALQLAREPHVVRAQRLTEQTRGNAAVVNATAAQPLLLDIDIPPDSPSSRYICTIVNRRGEISKAMFVSAAEARDTVQITIPAGALDPGDYTLRVATAEGVAVASYPFAIR
ncbi:MAG TPA: zf-HC2 domain-containing protein [Thermoanaerobaculia bacterium]|nr:zf-HC2 domain-containing protein [Thermoanaerobaculia bacterium]